MTSQKGDPLLALILVASFVGAIIVAMIFLFVGAYQNSSQTQTSQPPLTTGVVGWNTVKNDQLGFSLQYPNNFFDPGHEPKIVDTRTNPLGREFPNNIQEVFINNVAYYYSHEQNAAAGHRYFSDYYQPKQNTFFYIELDTAETNCDNYLSLESGNTEQTKSYQNCIANNTNRPKVLQQIVNTFQFIK